MNHSSKVSERIPYSSLGQEPHEESSITKDSESLKYFITKSLEKGISILVSGFFVTLLFLIVTKEINFENTEDKVFPKDEEQAFSVGTHGSASKSKNYAVIHMGPHKTGSSTIQAYEAKFHKELTQDGYEEPYSWVKNVWEGEALERMMLLENQVQFATCFLPPNDYSRIKYPCVYELLHAAMEISAEGKNLLVSAETFDHSDGDGMNALAAYMSVYDKTIVALFYRRLFDWLASVDNQERKGRQIEDMEGKRAWLWESSIVDRVQKSFEEQKVDFTYISSVLERAEKHFDHIEVINMHDEKDNNEEFLCHVLPNANHTCAALMNEKEEMHANVHMDLIYQDLAYGAMKRGLVDIKSSDIKLQQVTKAVRDYQENALRLTKDDFPMTCLPSETEKWLLDVSLEIEEKLLPEFFKSPLGEKRLKAEFAEKSKTSLCELDADSTLKKRVWIDFFSKNEF